jgi:hypothetical protein
MVPLPTELALSFGGKVAEIALGNIFGLEIKRKICQINPCALLLSLEGR